MTSYTIFSMLSLKFVEQIRRPLFAQNGCQSPRTRGDRVKILVLGLWTHSPVGNRPDPSFGPEAFAIGTQDRTKDRIAEEESSLTNL